MAIIYDPQHPYQPQPNQPGTFSPGGGGYQPTQPGQPYAGTLGGAPAYSGRMSRAGMATQSFAGGFGSYSRFGTHNGFYGGRFASPGGGSLFGNYPSQQNQQQQTYQPYPNANQFQGNGGWPFVFQSAPQPFVQPRSG